jgi:DNA invertase Pin-like site-specific DNA recombinase
MTLTLRKSNVEAGKCFPAYIHPKLKASPDRCLDGRAGFERELIKTRTGEGRVRAMARGVRFGRKPKLSRFQIAEALRRREAGESLTDIARTYGVNHSTISRLRPRPPMPYLVAAE